MRTIGMIREFETPNFKVIVRAEEEQDLDLSWDEDGSIAEGLDNGRYIAFCAHALVVYKPTGAVLADDYLGNCIYESLEAFMDHKGANGQYGSYFVDMVGTVCAEARKAMQDMKAVRVRMPKC